MVTNSVSWERTRKFPEGSIFLEAQKTNKIECEQKSLPCQRSNLDKGLWRWDTQSISTPESTATGFTISGRDWEESSDEESEKETG